MDYKRCLQPSQKASFIRIYIDLETDKLFVTFTEANNCRNSSLKTTIFYYTICISTPYKILYWSNNLKFFINVLLRRTKNAEVLISYMYILINMTKVLEILQTFNKPFPRVTNKIEKEYKLEYM